MFLRQKLALSRFPAASGAQEHHDGPSRLGFGSRGDGVGCWLLLLLLLLLAHGEYSRARDTSCMLEHGRRRHEPSWWEMRSRRRNRKASTMENRPWCEGRSHHHPVRRRRTVVGKGKVGTSSSLKGRRRHHAHHRGGLLLLRRIGGRMIGVQKAPIAAAAAARGRATTTTVQVRAAQGPARDERRSSCRK